MRLVVLLKLPRNATGDLGNFDRVCQSCPIEVAIAKIQHLGLALQPSEGCGMDNASVVNRSGVVRPLAEVATVRVVPATFPNSSPVASAAIASVRSCRHAYCIVATCGRSWNAFLRLPECGRRRHMAPSISPIRTRSVPSITPRRRRSTSIEPCVKTFVRYAFPSFRSSKNFASSSFIPDIHQFCRTRSRDCRFHNSSPRVPPGNLQHAVHGTVHLRPLRQEPTRPRGASPEAPGVILGPEGAGRS